MENGPYDILTLNELKVEILLKIKVDKLVPQQSTYCAAAYVV